MLDQISSLSPSALDTRPHAIVIGAGLGGLAAAMRLGARGYRVSIFERLNMVGGRASVISRGGYRFDLGPTIVTVPQVFRDLFRACDENFDDYVTLKPLSPFYEIRYPDGSSFQMSGSTSEVRRQIARMCPEDLTGYDRFLKDAEARYAFGFEELGRKPMHRLWDLIKVLPKFAVMRADRSIYQHAARRFKDERLRFAMSFHPLFIGGDPFRVTSMYALVAHLEKAFGVHYAQGGVGAIANAMQSVIEKQGGLIQLQTTVSDIITKNKRATGVTLSNGIVISADIVVSNADAGHTYDKLLKAAPKRRWTPKRLMRSKWSMGLFVWYFGTKNTRAMWPETGHHTILPSNRYAGEVRDIFRKGVVSDDMSLYLHRPSVNDPSVAPKNGDSFYALACVPHLARRTGVDWEKEAEAYKAKLAEKLEATLLPSLRQHIVEEHILTPIDFQTRYLSPNGSGFSLEPRILQSAWFRPHNISEEIENLFLVGAGTHPGAGLPGVIASAEVLDQLVPDATEFATMV